MYLHVEMRYFRESEGAISYSKYGNVLGFQSSSNYAIHAADDLEQNKVFGFECKSRDIFIRYKRHSSGIRFSVRLARTISMKGWMSIKSGTFTLAFTRFAKRA
jgi:hypothetical protein